MNVDHISSEEIKKDIADTESEISQLKIEADAYEKLYRVGNDKILYLKYRNRLDGIEEREKFVLKLKGILHERQEHRGNS